MLGRPLLESVVSFADPSRKEVVGLVSTLGGAFEGSSLFGGPLEQGILEKVGLVAGGLGGVVAPLDLRVGESRPEKGSAVLRVGQYPAMGYF